MKKLPASHRGLILNRRHALLGMASTLVVPVISSSSSAFAKSVIVTPEQTEGPFYPENWIGDIDNDLVVVKGQAVKSMGTVLHLRGAVLNSKGQPLPAVTVEIWQCDSRGIYRHSEDETPDRKHDNGFQGYGRTLTDRMGYYSFRTIRPVPYTGRTPHIHFRVIAKGLPPLTTQMYIRGEPLNASDFVLGSIRDAGKREALMISLENSDHIEQGSLTGNFNIIFT